MLIKQSQLLQRFGLGRISVESHLQEQVYYSEDKKITVFLSHKHDEYEQVDSSGDMLAKHGASVYMDWLDENMPNATNAETANKLKQQIQKSHKFIFLATENAIASKWCNWELGLGDAYKGHNNNIALLPVEDDQRRFTGSEYLRIYPYIEYRDGTDSYTDGRPIPKGFYVCTHANKKRTMVKLNEWLQR